VRFVDSHVHLSDYGDLSAVIKGASMTDTFLLACGVDRDTSSTTLRLRALHPESVRAFVGVHPSEVGKSPSLDWFAPALAAADGAGEIGLDTKYVATSAAASQEVVLRGQLALAEKLRKPVQVHSRGAEERCLAEFSSFRLKSVLLHWFEGEGHVRQAQDRGYYVSFGPALLHSAKLRRIARAYDPSLTLTETDGPVSFTALGGVGGPTLIPSVVFELAQVWGTTFEATAERLMANSLGYLGEVAKG
jgi:TatD DNase family protein